MPSFDEIRQSVSGSINKAGSVVGLTPMSVATNDEEEQKQPDRLDELSEMCPKLSFQQVRMYCWLGLSVASVSGLCTLTKVVSLVLSPHITMDRELRDLQFALAWDISLHSVRSHYLFE